MYNTNLHMQTNVYTADAGANWLIHRAAAAEIR